MALINPLRDIILMSLLEWDAWDEVFRIKAKSSNLWAYINPNIDGKKLFERSIQLEVLDFLKYIYHSR